MMHRLHSSELKIHYGELNGAGWWIGERMIDSCEQLQPPSHPMFNTYARILGTADWDESVLVRTQRIRRPL